MSKVIIEKNLNGKLFAENIKYSDEQKGVRFIIELALS